MPNRLAGETSPYLLQHQHNPVDWWPWSRQAFVEASERDVPVFLSVGYSTCYWCHVMERQVFENEAIARQMNAGFVNIKVDREERPDVDEHYMTATQVLTGQGGWPMSVFLTARGEPFFAGTYFPPEDQHGRPGFPRVLEALVQAWRDRRADIEQTVGTLRGILQRLGEPAPPGEAVTFNEGLLVELALRSAADYDPRHGGFGGAPKFPRQTLFEMLLAARAAFGEHLPQIDRPLRHTLDAMANGGIRDHLGGGFHRYSTDAKWLVPHFEIMLYDQALLAWCYAEAAGQFGAQRYGRVARGICDFVLREMTDASGAFYTAFDAEVDASEGSSYLWTPPEVKAVLGLNDAGLFSEVYGLDQGFNFADPHGPLPDLPDRNVLFLAKPQLEDDPRIIAMRARLKAARDARKQPLLDTKIITSWNGLMIRSLAHAGETLGEPRYTAAAHKAADWLWREHRTEDGMLIHSSRRDAAHFAGGVTGAHAQRISGFLDDYAFLGLGLLAMAKRSKPSGGLNWQQRAAQIADYLAQHFADEQHGGFFFSDVSHDDLGAMTGVRRKIGADSPLPAGNAAAALLMLELDRPEPCRRTLEVFAGQIVDHVGNTSALLEAAIRYHQAQGPFSISGSAAPAQSEDQTVVEIAGAAWETPQRLAVRLRIADGYHVYAEDAEHAQALALSSPHAAFTRTHAPPAREGQYRGEVRFVLEFSAPVNRETVDVSLRYQACDETRCLLPVSQQLHVAPGQP